MDDPGQGGEPQLLSRSSDWSPSRLHLRRLRALWRSAGWPCLDATEIDLLAAGLVERVAPPVGRPGLETLRLTDLGLFWLKRSLDNNRGAFGAHEALVARSAESLLAQGRIVWTGLSLRAPLEGAVPSDIPPEPIQSESDLFGTRPARSVSAARWRLCRPDVFSIRYTSDPGRLASRIDEVKSRRSDLLGDLRQGEKRAAYLALADECWYVLGADEAGRPIADPSELPLECGVLVEEAGRLRLARPAPRRASRVPLFSVWMALARAVPFASNRAEGAAGEPGDSAQWPLVPDADPDPPGWVG